MKLNDSELRNKAQWDKAGIRLPGFDRAGMISQTEKTPQWVHFGAGNIFRIFPASLQQSLIERGIEKTGIIMVAGRDGEIIEKIFRPCDNLTLGVTLKSDGDIEKTVIGSITKSLWMGKKEDFEELKQVFRNPVLQMASFTITEKAYKIPEGAGAENYLWTVTALLYERYLAGRAPLAMVSMDNCSKNGDVLFSAVETFAIKLVENGIAERGFLDYVRNRELLSFPLSMIDKITPGPDIGVKDLLERDGFTDTEFYSKSSSTAPFVNAEETGYLVIEDSFPNGRPALEQAGVYFTDRETVDRVEKMKVGTCLNPLHTALAIFGCLLGYTKISEEMKNPLLVKLIEGIGYTEGLPVVINPGIIDPKEFIDTVIKVRLPNPFLPDTPQRIATDTSQKIPIRFGQTIKAYLDQGRSLENMVFIPLTLAAWLRYLLGIDDRGNSFVPSPDPRSDELASMLKGIRVGEPGPFREKLKPILTDPTLFGVNLYEAGSAESLGEKVERYFTELVSGPGAVENVLRIM
ncbi:MAG: mannitol dehydrogenase family protein [Treponema sp.]|nr:mannitol dehydrogenase family protein [Treponema sp.]